MDVWKPSHYKGEQEASEEIISVLNKRYKYITNRNESKNKTAIYQTTNQY